MKISATELMKKLKYLEEEINAIYRDDAESSYVPVDKVLTEDGTRKIVPLYEITYDFEENRKRIEELNKQEVKIRRVLNDFNTKTKVIGYDFNINEGLVRLAQLKEEVRHLTAMLNKGRYYRDNYRTETTMAAYNYEIARATLRELQQKLSAIQVAIDKTNLNSVVEYVD